MEKRSRFPILLLQLGMFVLAGFLIFIWAAPSSVSASQSFGATDISVINNRWLDSSTLRQFGESASHLIQAETNEEKAIAVFRAIQQSTMVTTNVPREPAYDDDYIVNPEKLLNVYGAHWGDGLSRIMQMTWRSMGYRAEKLYQFDHTLSDIHYEDEDGVERWHVFDNSADHWFLWDRTGTHIATSEELILDQSLSSRPSRTLVPTQASLPVPSYIHESHMQFLDYSNHFNLRNGEKATFYWSNLNKPYYAPSGNDVGGLDFEHGPYEKTFGNALWEYEPDLSEVSYKEGLFSDPVHVYSLEEDGLKPNLHPDRIDTTASIVYRFSYPYIISDAWIDAEFLRNNTQDTINISISNDGSNWKTIWSADSLGQILLEELNINERFDVEQPYPQGLITPFGHYEYFLKIDMSAEEYVTDCGLERLSVTTVTQHNIFSLPQLWPVKNEVTISGDISQGTSLRVTYLWEDLNGLQQNIVLVENAPFTYTIMADGTKWEEVVSKQITIEALPRIGEGNQIIQQEQPPLNTRDVTLSEAFQTDKIVGQWQPPELFDTARYIQDINQGLNDGDFGMVHEALSGLAVLSDPAAKDAILDVIYHDSSYKYFTKYWAAQALYSSVGADTLPAMIDILERDPSIGWTDVTGEFDDDSAWLWTSSMAAFILSKINNPAARQAAPLIADLLDSAKLQAKLGGRDPSGIYGWEEIRWGLIRALGVLGGPEQVPTLLDEIDKEWTGESSYNAVLALANIGDKSVAPTILDFMDRSVIQGSNRMKVLVSIEALGKLGDESLAPKLYPYLDDWDENFRGYAAIALGELGNKDAIPYLDELLQKETFPWVIEAVQESIILLQGGTTPSFTDVPASHWAFNAIETLYKQGYVAGCSVDPRMYCPDQNMTRAESAVFIERGNRGADYLPPQPVDPIFSDVSLDEWYAKWATGLWKDGFTAGCGINPLVYCPLQENTMAEGAVFFLRMLNGPDFEPPEATGIFQDAPPTSWFSPWVEAAYQAGIYLPCQTEPDLYACPEEPLTRAMGAYMMAQVKDLE
jgi:HEAT repeat protein